jgi:hypothetical protein
MNGQCCRRVREKKIRIFLEQKKWRRAEMVVGGRFLLSHVERKSSREIDRSASQLINDGRGFLIADQTFLLISDLMSEMVFRSKKEETYVPMIT